MIGRRIEKILEREQTVGENRGGTAEGGGGEIKAE